MTVLKKNIRGILRNPRPWPVTFCVRASSAAVSTHDASSRVTSIPYQLTKAGAATWRLSTWRWRKWMEATRNHNSVGPNQGVFGALLLYSCCCWSWPLQQRRHSPSCSIWALEGQQVAIYARRMRALASQIVCEKPWIDLLILVKIFITLLVEIGCPKIILQAVSMLTLNMRSYIWVLYGSRNDSFLLQ